MMCNVSELWLSIHWSSVPWKPTIFIININTSNLRTEMAIDNLKICRSTLCQLCDMVMKYTLPVKVRKDSGKTLDFYYTIIYQGILEQFSSDIGCNLLNNNLPVQCARRSSSKDSNDLVILQSLIFSVSNVSTLYWWYEMFLINFLSILVVCYGLFTCDKWGIQQQRLYRCDGGLEVSDFLSATPPSSSGPSQTDFWYGSLRFHSCGKKIYAYRKYAMKVVYFDNRTTIDLALIYPKKEIQSKA